MNAHIELPRRGGMKPPEGTSEKDRKTIERITHSFYGHDEAMPPGECNCFTKGEPKWCLLWQEHVEQQIDIMRGK